MERSTLESLTSNEILRRIAQRAFQFYEARSRQDGHDVEDWLKAEQEIRGGSTVPKASIAAAVYED
jgi:DUF2934 family protein